MSSKIPTLPIFTKLYACILDFKMFSMFKKDPKERDTTWNTLKADLVKQKELNQIAINLSMINEDTLESGFQVDTFYRG